MNIDFLATHYPTLWSVVVIPLLICMARVMDVSIGTLRIVFLSRGMKVLAPILGFFEVIVWLLAISQVMQHMDSWINYVAYGTGFALGNYLGIVIEEKLSMGHVILRVITRKSAIDLIEHFRHDGHRMTVVDAEGLKGPVQILFTIARRKQVPELLEITRRYNPDAIYSVEDVRSLSSNALEPVFSSAPGNGKRLFRFHRKGK